MASRRKAADPSPLTPAVEPVPGFEHATTRLEQIAELLEGGDLQLHESLALFEEGIGLLRAAEAALGAAELRIQQLSESVGGARLEPWDPSD